MYPKLFIGTPFVTPSWEICLAIGIFIVAILEISLRPKDFPVSRLGIGFLVMLMVYFGLLGAKLTFIALHWTLLSAEGKSFSSLIRHAGYAFPGALVFVVISIALFTKIRVKRISFLKVADYMLPFLMLKMAFVRIGCFLSGCCYGRPTEVPWGVVFARLSPPADLAIVRHPTQAYEILFLIFIYVLTRFVYGKKPANGVTFLTSLFLYGIFRFLLEFYRVDSSKIFGTIMLSHLAMLSIALISGAMLVICTRKH